MKVAFSSELKVTLAEAKAVTIKTYPDLKEKVEEVKNKIELEDLLNEQGFIVYMEIDPEDEQREFLLAEAEMQDEVDARLAEGYCEPPLEELVFTEEDLAEICEVPEEVVIPEIDITDFELELKKEIRKMDGGLSEGVPLAEIDADSPIGKAMGCMQEIQDITDQLAILSDREKYIKETVINLEQLLYHYRTMEEYYTTKQETLDGLTNQFTVLLREKRHIEDIDIPGHEAEITRLTALRDEHTNNLFAGTQRPTATENSYNAKITVENDAITAFEERIVELDETIEKNKDNTWSFDNDNLQNVSLVNRKAELRSQLQAVGSVASLGNFSSNIEMYTPANASIEDGFRLKIRHETIDEAGILTGIPMLFAESHGLVTIQDYRQQDPTGVLYSALYNIWGDIELFFTREERGLTTNGNQMDPTLQNTGALPVNGNYIQYLSKFEDFYTNFDTYHTQKTDSVKANVIEPALLQTQQSMKTTATKEVQLLLSFGKVFEILPEDYVLETASGSDKSATRLNGLINTIKNQSSEYLQKLDACREVYQYAQDKHAEILIEIEKKKGEYSQVSCADGGDPGEPMKEAGGDPLGKTTMGKEDPNDPNFTKYCYWLKFAQHATAVGLLPLPGPGGFKYWPIGLTIPSPGGLIKIPLPVIWVPLTVIALPVGVFVMFIGQCGIVPSPFLLYIGATGEKKFMVSLRPTQEFGANASDGTLKLLTQGGIAINAKINQLLAGLPVVPGFPSIDIPDFLNLFPDSGSTLIEDTKGTIIRKINKIKLPDVSKLNDLHPGARIEEKKQAFKDVVETWLNDLKIPDLKFPKNSKGVNPKPTAMLEMLDQLKKLADMELPNIIPPIEQIDITAEVVSRIGGIKVPEINLPPRLANGITIPPLGDPAKVEAFVADVKETMTKIMAASLDKITPKALGIAATFGDLPVFLNPYQCRQSGGGLALPNIGPLTGALAALKGAGAGIIASLDAKLITDNFIGGQTIAPPPVTPEAIISMLKGIVETALPQVSIPNLANVSIKDMIQNGVKAITGLSLPSLPAPGPIQIRVVIPGSLLKNALVPAVTNTIDAALDPLSLPPFDIISPIDVKQIAINFIEESFAPVEQVMNPILTTVNIISNIKLQNMGFGEMLGLGKVTLDPLKVQIAPELPLLVATKILEALPPPPYPAVAAAPTVFKLIHPMLSQDDLPPWDRLSLSNPLYVVFLDQFCSQGKKGGGLFENP